MTLRQILLPLFVALLAGVSVTPAGAETVQVAPPFGRVTTSEKCLAQPNLEVPVLCETDASATLAGGLSSSVRVLSPPALQMNGFAESRVHFVHQVEDVAYVTYRVFYRVLSTSARYEPAPVPVSRPGEWTSVVFGFAWENSIGGHVLVDEQGAQPVRSPLVMGMGLGAGPSTIEFDLALRTEASLGRRGGVIESGAKVQIDSVTATLFPCSDARPCVP